ncbi:MAG: hypothetical protein HYX75_15340 [Acidobacteria bacterium]|nr:hypothetical protein [Acidobacteriota bacterium]
MSTTRYPWTRFWIPRGDIVHFDDGGYFSDPVVGVGQYLHENARMLASLRDCPCLVLLGEGGAGKTDEMSMLREQIHSAGSGEKVLFRDLGTYGSEDQLHADLFGSDVFREWTRGTDRLVLFLDSLDEAFLEFNTVAELIKRGLRDAPVNRLSIRIACRNVCWPESLSAYFTGCFGPENVGTYALAPLRRVDVKRAIEEEGLDGDAFLAAVAATEAQAFAINPSTLRMLIGVFKNKGGLPRRKSDLYEQGLKHLCEPSDERRERQRGPALSATEMLDVAAHIAAMTILTGRPSIYDGHEWDAPVRCVSLSSLGVAGPAAAGSEQIASEQNIQMTLRNTGLFTSEGPNQYKFSHRTYQEYLAARFLARANLSPQQLDSLLFHPEGKPRQLIPQLREVAAWIGVLNPGFFERVFQSEPETVLLCDSSVLDGDIKARVVNELLVKIERGDLPEELTESLSEHFHKLRYPGLAEQVSKVMLDTERNWRVRLIAMDIVAECGLRDLAGMVARLALDQTLDMQLRTQAALTVERLRDDDACQMLRPLALGLAGEDPDDELRGCGLNATWPEHLTVRELFNSLTPPKKRHYVGTYSVFLHKTGMLSGLDDDGLRIAMRWAGSQLPPGESTHALDQIVVLLAKRAWTNMNDPVVLENLALLAIRHSMEQLPLFGTGSQEDEILSPDPYEVTSQMIQHDTERRRKLITGVVQCAVGIADIRALSINPTPLCLTDDFPWLVQEALEADGVTAEVWSELARMAFDINDPDHVSIWVVARDKSAALASAMPWPVSVDLSSQAARAGRNRLEDLRQREQRQRSMRESLPPRGQRVKELATLCRGGAVELFWRLAAEMSAAGESPWTSITLDLTSTPGWKEADQPTRESIREAARRYLGDAVLDPNAYLGSGQIRLSDLAPPQAALLLLDENPRSLDDLDKQRWRVLSPCVLAALDGIPSHNAEAARRVLALAWNKVPDEARTTTRLLIARRAAQSYLPTILSLLGPVADEEFLIGLLGELKENPSAWMAFGDILGWLIDQKAPGALQHAEGLVRTPVAIDLLERDCSIEAGTALMLYGPDAGWRVMWPALSVDPTWGKEVLERVADKADDRDIVVEERLSDDSVGLLLSWLVRENSPETDDEPQGAFVATQEWGVREWRNRLVCHLRDRGTRSSCAAIERLCSEYPAIEWLRAVLAAANENLRSNSWAPPTPAHILALVESSRRRYVTSGSQLLDLICESLERLAMTLHGETPAVRFLWENAETSTPRPVIENKLSDYVAIHLRDDLQGEVVVNREVEVRAPLRSVEGAGQETDIHVTARLTRDSWAPTDILSAIVEVKGCWNPDVRHAMKTQLVGRYVHENPSPFGLYLVG